MDNTNMSLRVFTMAKGLDLLIREELEGDEPDMPEITEEVFLDHFAETPLGNIESIGDYLVERPALLGEIVANINSSYESIYDYPEHMARFGLPSSLYGPCDKRCEK